jgi:hypothetical protein
MDRMIHAIGSSALVLRQALLFPIRPRHNIILDKTACISIINKANTADLRNRAAEGVLKKGLLVF